MLSPTPQKHISDARKHVKSALTAQARFWAALLEPVPDVSALLAQTAVMHHAIQLSEMAFDELLRINSQVRRSILVS